MTDLPPPGRADWSGLQVVVAGLGIADTPLGPAVVRLCPDATKARPGRHTAA